MTRRVIRLAALAAALAFPAGAAAITAPHLNPLPANVLQGTVTISWSPSWFDAGYPCHSYVLLISDQPFGSTATYSQVNTDNLSTSLAVSGLHRYTVTVNAFEWKCFTPFDPDPRLSAPDTATFMAWPAPADMPRRP